jgi:hypothetical protein
VEILGIAVAQVRLLDAPEDPGRVIALRVITASTGICSGLLGAGSIVLAASAEAVIAFTASRKSRSVTMPASLPSLTTGS